MLVSLHNVLDHCDSTLKTASHFEQIFQLSTLVVYFGFPRYIDTHTELANNHWLGWHDEHRAGTPF